MKKVSASLKAAAPDLLSVVKRMIKRRKDGYQVTKSELEKAIKAVKKAKGK